MKWPQCSLEHQPDTHQQQRQPGRLVGLGQLGQHQNVQHAVAAIEQCDTKQIGERAGQRQHQVIEGRSISPASGQRHQCHGAEAEQLERHIQVEQVRRQPQCRQRGMQQTGQWPVILAAGGVGAACRVQSHQ